MKKKTEAKVKLNRKFVFGLFIGTVLAMALAFFLGYNYAGDTKPVVPISEGFYLEHNSSYEGKNVIKFYPVDCPQICFIKLYLNSSWERICSKGGIISQDYMIANKIKDIYINFPNNCWFDGLPEEWKE